jgi:hypothetical protein
MPTIYTYGFESDGISDNQHGDLVGIAYSNDPQSTPGIIYTYDRLGRRKTVARNGMTTSFTFPDSTLEASESYSGGTLGGLTVATSFDSVLRPQTLSVNTSNVLTRTFGYDEASRLQTVSDGAHSATYSILPILRSSGRLRSGKERPRG